MVYRLMRLSQSMTQISPGSYYSTISSCRSNFSSTNGMKAHSFLYPRKVTPQTLTSGRVTLMDIGNKIYRSIMRGQLLKIISKQGVKCQFISTPGIGWQDGTFRINIILHLRHNHNLPTWVSFADLVKAFDTSNHKPRIAILGKYGAPPRLFSEIKRMYKKSIVKIIIDKVETSINFKLVAKQGYSMAPVLFMLLMVALVKNLED